MINEEWARLNGACITSRVAGRLLHAVGEKARPCCLSQQPRQKLSDMRVASQSACDPTRAISLDTREIDHALARICEVESVAYAKLPICSSVNSVIMRNNEGQKTLTHDSFVHFVQYSVRPLAVGPSAVSRSVRGFQSWTAHPCAGADPHWLSPSYASHTASSSSPSNNLLRLVRHKPHQFGTDPLNRGIVARNVRVQMCCKARDARGALIKTGNAVQPGALDRVDRVSAPG